MRRFPLEERAVVVNSATGEEEGCAHTIACICGDLITLVILAAGVVWSFWAAMRIENVESGFYAFILGLVVVVIRYGLVLRKCGIGPTSDIQYQKHKARWFNRWSGWIWGVGLAILVNFLLMPRWWGLRVWIVEKQPVGSFSFALPWQTVQWIETEHFVRLSKVSATTAEGIEVTASIQTKFFGPYNDDVIRELTRDTKGGEVTVPTLDKIAKEWFRKGFATINHSTLKSIDEIGISRSAAPTELLERYDLKCDPNGLKVTDIRVQGDETHE